MRHVSPVTDSHIHTLDIYQNTRKYSKSKKKHRIGLRPNSVKAFEHGHEDEDDSMNHLTMTVC